MFESTYKGYLEGLTAQNLDCRRELYDTELAEAKFLETMTTQFLGKFK